MSRRGFPRLRLVLGLVAALAVVVLIVMFSVKRYSQPEAAPPEALAHIAQKNRDAAIVAAAHQREESAVSTNAAENLAEAQRRVQSDTNAMFDRSQSEIGIDPASRHR